MLKNFALEFIGENCDYWFAQKAEELVYTKQLHLPIIYIQYEAAKPQFAPRHRDSLAMFFVIAIILKENPDEGSIQFEDIDLTNDPPSPSYIIVNSPNTHFQVQNVARSEDKIIWIFHF